MFDSTNTMEGTSREPLVGAPSIEIASSHSSTALAECTQALLSSVREIEPIIDPQLKPITSPLRRKRLCSEVRGQVLRNLHERSSQGKGFYIIQDSPISSSRTGQAFRTAEMSNQSSRLVKIQNPRDSCLLSQSLVQETQPLH